MHIPGWTVVHAVIGVVQTLISASEVKHELHKGAKKCMTPKVV
jgi:flagellar motor component MotA